MKKNIKPHHLFHGDLSDAPGRNEEWDHYLDYRSNGQWVLITQSTDFSGTVEEPTSKVVMGSRKLLKWVIERDKEIIESEAHAVTDNDEEDAQRLGPFTKRLKEISIEVGAHYCADLIDRWVNGRWPPVAKGKKLVIRNVTGVTRRGVWIGIYHCVYAIDTNLGPAYMYEPDADGYATVILKSNSSTNQGRPKLSKSILSQVKKFQTDMNALKSKS